MKLPSLENDPFTRVGSPTRVDDVIILRRRIDPGLVYVRVE